MLLGPHLHDSLGIAAVVFCAYAAFVMYSSQRRQGRAIVDSKERTLAIAKRSNEAVAPPPPPPPPPPEAIQPALPLTA